MCPVLLFLFVFYLSVCLCLSPSAWQSHKAVEKILILFRFFFFLLFFIFESVFLYGALCIAAAAVTAYAPGLATGSSTPPRVFAALTHRKRDDNRVQSAFYARVEARRKTVCRCNSRLAFEITKYCALFYFILFFWRPIDWCCADKVHNAACIFNNVHRQSPLDSDTI